MKRIFMLAFGVVLIVSCAEYESTEPDMAVDLNRAKAIWIDAQRKNGGGNNGRVVDQLTPLFEQYSQHLAHNDLPFLKIPVATQNKVVHHMEGVDTDLELGTYLLYVDNHDGENLYLVNVVLGDGNSFNNGLVTVHDLAGQYIVGYRFQDGEYLLVSEERETTQNGRGNGVECWYVDHYTCTVRIGPDDCELDYTTVHCEYYADRPPLIFGDGSGEGGGSGEGSSLTGPVQCDDGYFADEQGRCINACGPGMVYDGNGGCELSPNEMCGVYNFTQVGSGLTIQLERLQAYGHHTNTNDVVTFFQGSICLTIYSSSGALDNSSASRIMNESWNLSIDDVESWLNQIEEKPSEVEFSNKIFEEWRAWLSQLTGGGYALSTGTCSGNIQGYVARYQCGLFGE